MTDAERNLLSAIMSPLGREFPDIDITPDDYSEVRHAEIHQAARKVAEAGRPINPVTVGDALGKGADVLYLHELVNFGIVPAQATYFAEIVAKEATRRRLKVAAAWLMQHADDEDPSATHDEIRGMLDRLPTVTTPVTRIGDTIDGTLNLLAEEDGGQLLLCCT